MKTDDIISRYLLKHKTVTLQSIGTFNIKSDIDVAEEGSNPLPANAIIFEYNQRAKEDDGLVTYIVEITKKIKPLASADLDSYVTLGKQFLNIGKPFIIEGVGTLEKTPDGISFKPGQFITPKIEAPKALKENEAEISSGFFGHSERTPPPNYDKRILATIALAIVAGIIAWVIYYYTIRDPKNKALVETTVKDTTPPPKDSVIPKQPEVNAVKAANDTVNFYVVIVDSLSHSRALSNQKLLLSKGHPAMVYTNDSVYYKVGELYSRPIKDTIKLKDSLAPYYHHMHIEVH